MDLDLAGPDVTCGVAPLAEAAAHLVTLLPGKPIDPVLAGARLAATSTGITLAGTDRERSARLTRSAATRVHTEGEVLVPARMLAETLRSLDVSEIRIAREGNKLALRTPSARFALPLLDISTHPGIPELPPCAGDLAAGALSTALIVAGAASRDDALPVFTGVHVRQNDDRLVLVGTDRFRMAVATLPWRPATTSLDVLLPATLISEATKQVAAAPKSRVGLHVDTHRVGLSFPGTEIVTTLIDAPFPDESRLLSTPPDCTVELETDPFASAVRRVATYAGAANVVELELGENELRLRANDPQGGDALETVKATVSGDRFRTAYHPRYLIDALRGFAGSHVRLALRNGERRASVLSSPEPGLVDLRYVVMPKRLR